MPRAAGSALGRRRRGGLWRCGPDRVGATHLRVAGGVGCDGAARTASVPPTSGWPAGWVVAVRS
ncbi:hypothetical protein FTX61_12700 [Nitriliruptoraceae bacterium ZYF776]|nr:hypothetical protein [Profundirhabdus halotolerans]